MKIFAFLIGIVLLPVCFAASRLVISLVQAIAPDNGGIMPDSAWALTLGFLLWIFLYFTMPMPVRTYVLAHELTHALWGAVMGAKIFRMRVSKDSGSVTMSKSNWFITLAPYFFPLYTVITIIIYYILSIFYDAGAWYLFWLVLVGFTWGFHFTFTISTLLQHQSDIKVYGAVFSYAVIYLLNVLGICFWIVIVSSATFEQMFAFAAGHMRETFISLYGTGLRVFEETRKALQ